MTEKKPQSFEINFIHTIGRRTKLYEGNLTFSDGSISRGVMVPWSLIKENTNAQRFPATKQAELFLNSPEGLERLAKKDF